MKLKLVYIGMVVLLWGFAFQQVKTQTNHHEVVASTTIIVTTTTTSTTSTTIPPTTTTLAKASRAKPTRIYPTGAIGDDVWSALSRCEAGGRPNAVSRNGKYFGAFQFSLATWHGIGMAGNPIDYPYEVQLEAAKRLQARSGWGQWPVCSRKLGLR